MKLACKWVGFQVGMPLVVPVALSGVFLFAWKSLDDRFVPRLRDVVDLTPWAIAIYSLTLIGATFERSWSKLDKSALSWLWLVAGANAVYYALLVIRRHQAGSDMPASAYYVTVVLMVASISVCYRARRG